MVASLEAERPAKGTVDAVLASAGLTREDLAQPTMRKDTICEAILMENACAALGDPGFGIRTGLSFRDSTTLNAYVAHYSETLRAALENSTRYYSVVDPAFAFVLHVSGGSAAVEIECRDARFAKYHRHREAMLCGLMARLRALTGVEFLPIEARFAHPGRAHRVPVRAITGFPVIFDAERTELVLPLTALDLPIPTYDPNLRRHLTDYADRLLSEQSASSTPLRARIEAHLARALPGRIVPADEVAASLGMSRRTLARRLQEEACNFRQIVDELRYDLARRYIEDGLSIGEIAYFLDYADQAAFSTAFKRWSGASPGAFRARHA